MTLINRSETSRGQDERVLVCTAHPDDEILIAGTLHRLVLAGAEVTLLCATRGESGAIRDSALADRRTVGVVRAREMEAAAQVLGLHRLVHLDYPDGDVKHRLDELSADIAAVLGEVDPGLVITFGPDGVTGHEDHITVGQATSDALAATGDGRHLCHFGLPHPVAVRLVMDYLLPSLEAAAEGVSAVDGFENADEATRRDWLARVGAPLETFDLRLDVSDLLETKALTFRCHATQPGSERAGDALFRSLFAEEFLRTVHPAGVVPTVLAPFVTEVVPRGATDRASTEAAHTT